MVEKKSYPPSQNRSSKQSYNHKKHERTRQFLRFLIRVIGFKLLAKMDRVEGVEHIPGQGPAILMINHIAMIDPVAVLSVVPRNIVPMAKIEAYDYPVFGIFPRLWGVIPVRREEFDRRAVQQAFEVLAAGEIILVAPEATRSPQLQLGKEGVAYIASRANAPILPVGIDGTPGFPALRTSARWKKEGVSICFGPAFRFRVENGRLERNQLRIMTTEAMYQLARLLPEHRRGVYADLSKATQETIEFL